ncbi:MAG: penicillin-binding transpeptidase domain-containing protein [Rhabdochlamydiaceae bacterium]
MSDRYNQHKIFITLKVILVVFLCILLRVWYLATFKQEDYFKLSRKPQRRTMIEHVPRGTISDRFGLPLAINKIQYNAAVCYADIRNIPSYSYEKNEAGQKVKIYLRSQYIRDLSNKLGQELDLDPSDIEDIIHAKASLFPHTPFVLKEDISEEKYCRLKMLEKDWVGIQTQETYKRVYPRGKLGSDILGFLGPINQKEYYQIAEEVKELKSYLKKREEGEAPFLPKGFSSPIEVRERLNQLNQKSYSLIDKVGKMGVEGAFDEELRGSLGKKIYEIDTKGNLLRLLPGSSSSSPGKHLTLSISSELQEYAEALLAQNEWNPHKDKISSRDYWIKGGAIVAMIPQTGEVVALASHPRFDPNDFISSSDPVLKASQQKRRLQWVENEDHIKNIWDGLQPLEKEWYSFARQSFYDLKTFLSWDDYISLSFSEESGLYKALKTIKTVKTLWDIQYHLKTLGAICGVEDVRAVLIALYPEAHKRRNQNSPSKDLIGLAKKGLSDHLEETLTHRAHLDPFFSLIPIFDDQLLFLDVCRMLLPFSDHKEEVKQSLEALSLEEYRHLNQVFARLEEFLKPFVQRKFHQTLFKQWREESFKEHLKQKRKEEKRQKKYARPYTDYLEQKEKELFKAFWEKERGDILFSILQSAKCLKKSSSSFLIEEVLDLSPIEGFSSLKAFLANSSQDNISDFIDLFRSFNDLKEPLIGKYRSLRSVGGQQFQKHLASSFYPLSGFGYGRSQAFRQSTPQGSVFKVVTSYEALKEKYEKDPSDGQQDLNPLTLIDDIKAEGLHSPEGQLLGSFLNGQKIRRKYKGGILPRSHPMIGEVDLIGALEQSSNIYFSILASDFIQDPTYLTSAAYQLGYGDKTGIELPDEIAGTLPRDLSHNRTGLYSFAIGQHSLVVTPLQTAVMMSTISNKGEVLQPKIIKKIVGRQVNTDLDELFSCKNYLFKDDLKLIGVDFPLFTENKNKEGDIQSIEKGKVVKREVFLPETIRDYLLKGMQKVVTGARGTARLSVLKNIHEMPHSTKDYHDLQRQLVAKTGTAEILYKHTVDKETYPKKENHVWFAGVSFQEEDSFHHPDLVIVVYLRFGKAGKDCAPLAGQIVKKWKEIRKKHQE